jgi:hypothetical protein
VYIGVTAACFDGLSYRRVYSPGLCPKPWLWPSPVGVQASPDGPGGANPARAQRSRHRPTASSPAGLSRTSSALTQITMYDLAGFLVANPIDRFRIGDMAEKPRPDPDGGLTLLIQHHSPGTDQQTNWLPVPSEGFFLMMRMYQPQERMYRGDYTVPAIERTSGKPSTPQRVTIHEPCTPDDLLPGEQTRPKIGSSKWLGPASQPPESGRSDACPTVAV